MKTPSSAPSASRWLVLAHVAGALACSHVPVAEPEPDVTVELDDTRQLLAGFGASLAWYQEALVAHPRADELYDHAFRELGLDVLRFRNRYQRSQEGVDLTVEATILQRATTSLGHPPRVLLTSWSPPAALKVSGREKCDGNTAACTLVREGGRFAYERFAGYWADSVEHYRGQGIDPEWISIQNEPDFTPGSWEGCRFEPSETDELPGYDRALEVVVEALAARGRSPKLIGPETLGVHNQRVERYVATLDRARLAAVAHHLYEMGGDGVWDWKTPGPDSYVGPMRGAVSAAGDLPVFQTEFATDEDEGILGGFETAWLILNSLVEGASAFLYWDLVWPESGLIALDGQAYRLRDQYFAVRHFARFTEPGDVRVVVRSGVTGLRATAFLAPAGDRLVVVLLNVGAGALTFRVGLGSFDRARARGYQSVFEPGHSQLWTELLSVPDELALPPRSVTTVVAE